MALDRTQARADLTQRLLNPPSRADLRNRLTSRILSDRDPGADLRIARKLLNVAQRSEIMVEEDGQYGLKLTARDRRNLAQALTVRIINGPAQVSSSTARYR